MLSATLKAIHLILTLLVLTSSTGIHVQAHFCTERLIDWSLLGAAKTCTGKEIQIETRNEESERGPTAHRIPCCQDINLYVQANQVTTSPDIEPLEATRWLGDANAPTHVFDAQTPSVQNAIPDGSLDIRPPPRPNTFSPSTLHRLARLQTYRI